MIRVLKFCAIVWLLTMVSTAQAVPIKPGDYYVNTDETSERLSPSKTGKITNTLFKRQKVTVIELKNGWARVSKYYDGEVEGIKGQVARWIEVSSLSEDRPAEENIVGTDKELGEALRSSDNFSRYKKVFTEAARRLIAERTCSLDDFKLAGGWMKSTQYSSGDVYFVYCGGLHRSNRLYFDVKTQKTFR